MKIHDTHYHSIWLSSDQKTVHVFDQRLFPHEIKIVDITNSEDAYVAIKEMIVRGAPLIGVTAAFGMYLATLEATDKRNVKTFLLERAERLKSSRPTAVNLMWAVDRVLSELDFYTELKNIQQQNKQ